MHRLNVFLYGACLTLSAMLILGSTQITAYATEYNDETVPVEETTGTVNEDVFDILAGENTMQDVAAYINYKRMYVKDVNAIKWSFILSQLAKPFEEDLTDVLSNDLVLQLRDNDVTISTTPEVLDSDYTYMPVGEEYTTSSVQFKEVWTTISQNIRYNSLLTDDLQQYTIKSFFTGGILGKQGFISDYVFTDADGTFSEEVPNAELKNNVSALFGLDFENNTQKLAEYLRNPSLSLTKDPNNSVRGQRRLVPVFVGSEISNMYLQIGMMVYCKENTGSSMTFNKFLDTYGMEKVYMDSYGNIAFYDSKTHGYKIMLPNACNSVFTSGQGAGKVELYGLNGRYVVDEAIKDLHKYDISKFELDVFSDGELKIPKPDGTKKDTELYRSMPGWSEETFIYNKLIGSAYSTKRRLTDSETDETDYSSDESVDMAIAHYSQFIGPNISNRADFRNSLVFAKPDFVYLSPNLYGKEAIGNAETTMAKFFLDYLSTTGTEKESFKYVPEYKCFSKFNLDAGNKVNGYLNLDEILFNSIVPNGTTIGGNGGNTMGTYASVKHALTQNSYMALLQIANDASITSTRNMTIKDASESKSDGAIAFPIHESQLGDVDNETLLGSEGGFLKEYKKIYKKEKKNYQITAKKYNDLSEEDKSRFIASKSNIVGGIDGYTTEVEAITANYSTNYLLKRDNRISNRYSMFPLDDIMTLSYVWLNDYLPRMTFSEFDKGAVIYNGTQQFLSTAAESGTTEEIAAIAFSTGGESLGELTWCDFSMLDTKKTEAVYKALKDDTDIDDNPFSRAIPLSVRATWMGLYRNTDSIINQDSPIKFKEKEKLVDIDALLQKINYGIDNPLTKMSNAVSGLCQLVHNAISVGKNSNFLTDILNSKLYTDTMIWYVCIGAVALLAWLSVKVIMTALNRRRITTVIADFMSLFVLVISIPLVFSLIVRFNTAGYERVMQTVNDKTTLVSVQKTVETFINKDKAAEKNYMAYRQQFSKINDIYQPSGVHLLDGMRSGEPVYKTKSIDEMANGITMKINQELVDVDGQRLWYTPESFIEVQKVKYTEDFSRYFYDYMVYEYLSYYNQPKFADTTYGSVASQINTTDKEVAVRIDKVIHNLKGGFNRILNDPEVKDKKDVTGIVKFMNTEVSSDVIKIPYLKFFAPVLDVTMRGNLGIKNILVNGKLVAPYGSTYLTLNEPWRMHYYKDYEEYIAAKPQQESAKLGKVDQAVYNAYENTIRRMNELVKYRVGEFSDTAIIYTSSLIAAQELAQELGGVDYGVKEVSDLDKIFRVIYSGNKEDLYNEEAVMYSIQDRIQGGVFLSVMLALYEVFYLIVTAINMVISVFAAFILPICLWVAWRRKLSNSVAHCFIGMLTQVLTQLLTLYVILVPLSVMSRIANKPMSSLGYWIATVVLLILSVVSTVVSLKLFKVFLMDMSTMGGSIIAASITSFASQIGSASLTSNDVQVANPVVNMDSASVSMTNADPTIEADTVDMLVEQNTLLSEEEQTSTPIYEYSEEAALEEQDNLT